MLFVGRAPVENGAEVPKKLKAELPYNPAIPILDICPEKNYSLKRPLRIQMHPTFMAVLRTTAGTQKHATCPWDG